MAITGIEIAVLRPQMVKDRLGNEVEGSFERESVANVLLVPGATADMQASRPAGVSVAFTLHFPKSLGRNSRNTSSEGSLEGCSIELPPPWGGIYKVVGDPQPYMNHMVPGAWNRPVEVEAAHG